MAGNVSALSGPSYVGGLLLSVFKDGQVSESLLDNMAERVQTPYFLLGQDDDYPTVDPASGDSFSVYQYGSNSELLFNFPKAPARDVRGNHATLIRQMGAASTVLLKV
ncbi:hypothetical protein NW755_012901 [Fusarium falciforme]|uniref:Uncharacterized protein n=1 Tax=Fusarium falciforme TaxID=195108 RepID=A0A9W8UW43_9HYPO|nr:hypothetical protein NW755_012901 [Fusarium falciforme]